MYASRYHIVLGLYKLEVESQFRELRASTVALARVWVRGLSRSQLTTAQSATSHGFEYVVRTVDLSRVSQSKQMIPDSSFRIVHVVPRA
jgi:hypothetical protein